MTFSRHFKVTISIIAVLAMILLYLGMRLEKKIAGMKTPTASSPRIDLPKNDKELISFNENTHKITVTTSKGTVQEYSRNPKVEIRKDGTVKVDADAWGTELRPFLGPGYSDTGRLYLGCDLFYFHSFDAGASFGWTANADKPLLQPMLSIGYNVWSNTSLNIGVNPVPFVSQEKPQYAVFLTVRL